jgi:hypothetical protein
VAGQVLIVPEATGERRRLLAALGLSGLAFGLWIAASLTAGLWRPQSSSVWPELALGVTAGHVFTLALGAVAAVRLGTGDAQLACVRGILAVPLVLAGIAAAVYLFFLFELGWSRSEPIAAILSVAALASAIAAEGLFLVAGLRAHFRLRLGGSFGSRTR